MIIDFDPNKSLRNEQERGLPFSLAEAFDWPHAVIWEDTRKPYPETRYLGLGYIGKRLHVLCFTLIGLDFIRVISLRKANEREIKRYEAETTH